MPGKNHRIGKSLIEVQRAFGTDAQCHAYLESARWPEGVRCLKCDGDQISKFVTNETTRERVNRKGETVTVKVPARHLYQCLNAACSYQFSTTTGTLFNDTHLPLTKWFLAVALVCNAKKGVSAKQLERDLDVNYRTAWYLSHRIRKAMEEGNLWDDKMTGVVEADETYVGGRYDKRVKRDKYDKPPVIGFIQRGTEHTHSKVRAIHVPERLNALNVAAHVRQNVASDARFMTDESNLYAWLDEYDRNVVKHIVKEWVRGDVHTNSIENFWSLFKRAVIGTYHKVSVKHLNRYLSEFNFRFNNRRNEEMFAMTILALVIASKMPYAELIGKTSAPEPSGGVPF